MSNYKVTGITKDLELSFKTGYAYNLNHKNNNLLSKYLKLIALLDYRPDIYYNYNELPLDYDYMLESPLLREKITYVFKEGILLSNLSIRENMLLSLNFYLPNLAKNKKMELIWDFFKQYELSKLLDFRPSQLEISMVKLVSVLRVFLQKSEFIILDSPFFLMESDEAVILNTVLETYQSEKAYIMSNALPALIQYQELFV